MSKLIPPTVIEKVSEASNLAGQVRIAIIAKDIQHANKCLDRIDELLFEAERQLERVEP